MTSFEEAVSGLAGKRVLCAVSGGTDSMCLLHALHRVGAEVTAAHFEHGIRGAESLRDAEFVERICGEWGLPCVVGHGDVPGYAARRGLGIEEAARLLRYEFLQSTLERLDMQLIATAHNADDRVETMLFNLCRGAGAAGLRGIPAERGNIVRPLLELSRAQIEAYLTENGIPHVEDGSNSSDDYSRNLIRHRVIPVLREINPELSAACGRTAELLARDEDCLGALAGDFIDRHFDGESLPCGELLALHPALSTRVLRRLLGAGLSMGHVESVLALCGSTERRFADVPGRRLRVERGRLWLREETGESLKSRTLDVSACGSLPIPEAGLRLRWEIAEYGGEINDLFKTYYLKYENISPVLTLSGKRPGDRLRLPGRGCSKTLKSLFAEAGCTREKRELCPVLRDEKGVAAVYGFGVDERLCPSPGDKVLKIEFSNIAGDNS